MDFSFLYDLEGGSDFLELSLHLLLGFAEVLIFSLLFFGLLSLCFVLVSFHDSLLSLRVLVELANYLKEISQSGLHFCQLLIIVGSWLDQLCGLIGFEELSLREYLCEFDDFTLEQSQGFPVLSICFFCLEEALMTFGKVEVEARRKSFSQTWIGRADFKGFFKCLYCFLVVIVEVEEFSFRCQDLEIKLETEFHSYLGLMAIDAIFAHKGSDELESSVEELHDVV